MPPSAIRAILERWANGAEDDLKAVIVRQHGATIAERYYDGAGQATPHDIRSAGKSVTSLLVGIAIDQGLIEGTHDLVTRYLPEAAHGALDGVRIEDLLTMRSGLDAWDADPDSPGNENNMDASADPFAFALAVPARWAPGQHYAYNSVTAYVTGLVLERACGRGIDEFAQDALFAPLGITQWRWRRDAAGHATGQGNLSITARDLATIGQMVLDGGVYAGRRVVGEQWIAASLEPRVRIDAVDPYADAYGFMWYLKTHTIAGRRVPVFFASGNGGNKIYLVPSRSLIVAITSSAYGKPNGQRRSEQILLELLAGGVS